MANDAQTPELLPCPFCGSGPTVSIQGASFSGVEALYWHGLHFVSCGTCGAEGSREEDRFAAITAWNRRADLYASGQQVRALMERWRDGEFENTADDAAQIAIEEQGADLDATPVIEAWLIALASLTPAPQPEGRVRALELRLRDWQGRAEMAGRALEAVLSGKPVQNADEIISFCKTAALTPAPDAPQPTPATQTEQEAVPVTGDLFIDSDGDLCITGRDKNLVACLATDDADGDWKPLNPDVFPEIVRRWNAHPPQPSETASLRALKGEQ